MTEEIEVTVEIATMIEIEIVSIRIEEIEVTVDSYYRASNRTSAQSPRKVVLLFVSYVRRILLLGP